MKKILLPVSLIITIIITFCFPSTSKSASYRFFELFMNQKTAYVDGQPYQLDQPPITINGRTMVPLRFIVESIGAKNLSYEEHPQERVTFNLPDSSLLISENDQLKKQNSQLKEEIEKLKKRINELENPSPEPPPEPSEPGDSNLSMYLLDVGQGDSILLQTKNKNVLIDAGPKSGECADQLKQLGIQNLDMVILTHQHADHFGGMEEVFQTFPCQEFIYNGLDIDTAAWNELEYLIDNKGVAKVIGKRGTYFNLDGIDYSFLAPTNPVASDLNNSSLVLKVSAGETDFLLMGDAEIAEENEILQYYPELDCEILKVGHHGSNSSSSLNFLYTVTPEVSLISCGAGNQYGHPHQETIDKLRNINSNIYRTDINGTILIEIDGAEYRITCSKEGDTPQPPPPETPKEIVKPTPPKNLATKINNGHVELKWEAANPGSDSIAGYNIYRKDQNSLYEILIKSIPAYTMFYADYSVNKEQTYTYSVTAFDSSSPTNESDHSNYSTITIPKEAEDNEIYVYITETGTKYHRDGCRFLSKSKIKITLKEAKARGYTPCSVCNPPILKLQFKEITKNLVTFMLTIREKIGVPGDRIR